MGRAALSAAADFAFSATLWRWKGDAPAAWYFITLPEDASAEIRLRTCGMRRGFGSVRVEVVIGGSRWRTSVFRSSGRDAYILPVKAAVRHTEGLSEGDAVRVELALIGA